MKNFKTIILLLAMTFLVLGVVVVAKAEETTTATTTDAENQVAASDLKVAEPTILPDSPFYFIKNWVRGLNVALTFNKIKKAELENKYAGEKLVELEKMTQNNAGEDKIKKATENYQQAVEKVKNLTDKIKEKAENNPEVSKFLEKFANQQVLQSKILEKLQEQVPAKALEKLKEARENHLEKFKELMLRLENKDKIPEKLKEALNGVNVNVSNVLDNLKDKMPEDIKERMEKVKEDVRDKVNTKLIDKATEKNEDKKCPAVSKPASDFCKNGIIKVKRDQKGCAIEFNCLIPSEQKVCTQEYSPVCGKDGKTYSNKCVAKNAGVEIAYAAECGKKECKQDSDCPQPNCAAQTTAATNCVNAKVKCVEGKCKIIDNSPKPSCKKLWWFDKENRICKRKEFCGAYVYLGLQTFIEKDACEKGLKILNNLSPLNVSPDSAGAANNSAVSQ